MRASLYKENKLIDSTAFRVKDFFLGKYNVYSLFSFMFLFLVIALRDRVGRDYINYARAYIKVNSGNLDVVTKDWLSIGYRILCKIVGIFGKENYRLMFAVVGFITLFFFYSAIKNMSKSAPLSLFLLISFCLYYQMFNQSRQMLAISITTFAFKYLLYKDKKQKFKFILFVGLATLIHTSAIVAFILFFLCNLNINAKTISFYILLTSIIYFSFDFVRYILSFTRYGQAYFGWIQRDTSFEISSIYNLVVRLLMIVICLLFSKSVVRRSSNTRGLYNAVLICTCLQIITLKSYLFSRLTTYFFIFYIFLIPEVLYSICESSKKNSKVLVYSMAIILFFIYHMIYYFSSNGASGSGYSIYQTFLF
jgi:hypothetical protein